MRPKKEKNKPGKIYTIPCAGNGRYPPPTYEMKKK